MKRPREQKGQVLVLIVLAIVVIFGFIALAVDVGSTYSERRRAQTAADAAAYAAAFARTQGDAYEPAAAYSLRLNGFEDDISAVNTAAKMDVQVYNPPISGKYATASETVRPFEYFQVIIRMRIDPIFSHFVFDRSMEFTVEAIAKGTASGSFADGASVVGLCSTCCSSVKFHGNSAINITNGNIISNSRRTNNPCDSAVDDGTACITLSNGRIFTGGSFGHPPPGATCPDSDDADSNPDPPIRGDVSPLINEGAVENLWSPNNNFEPTCTGEERSVPSPIHGAVTLNPGIYPNGIRINNPSAVITFNPGMYCLRDDFLVQGGTLKGDDVMFVMQNKSNGNYTSINITTSGTVTLTAPSDNLDGMIQDFECIPDDAPYTGYCWSGFLVYMLKDNQGTISLSGGNTTTYTGTIYAPGPPHASGTAKCSILGSASLESKMNMNASIICYTVDIGGQSGINLRYYEDAAAQVPSIVEMTK